jgi:hypothetical protein
MDQDRLRQQQKDRLHEHLIAEKEQEILLLEQQTKIKVESLKRDLKYLKGLNKQDGANKRGR